MGHRQSNWRTRLLLVMKDRVFGPGTTTRMLGSLDHPGSENSRKEIRAKETTKLDQQEPEDPSSVKNMHRDRLLGQKKIVFGGPRENEATKASTFLKGNAGFRKGGVRTGRSEHGSSNFFYQHQGKGKDQKGRGEGGAFPQTGFSASEKFR